MHESFDDLLRQGLLTPPEDFTGRVMAAIAREAQATAPRARWSLSRTLRWAALTGAATFGLSRAVSFALCAWTAGAAL